MPVNGSLLYRIIPDEMSDTVMYTFGHKDGLFVLVLNPNHPFYRKVYLPLLEKDDRESKSFRSQLDLMLLAAARAEAEATLPDHCDLLAWCRKAWSDNLTTFLNN
jgi:hypothetical protein